jgi:cellobiose dehydrogenase (acceptor)
MATPVSRVFSRIPGTYIPSQDGIDYNPNGYNLLGGALAAAGWSNVSANSVPNQKNRVFTRGPFMYSNAQRGGPLATYLATANARSNFKMMLNTNVRKVIRTGGHITGVLVEPFLPGGYSGVINVTATTGRVVLSAGTFGSPRILLRSGIGPTDQLQVVQSSASDGATMISNSSWINLPVGYNLDDHLNTNMVISHPSINFYDFYAAYTTPNTTDANQYLTKKSGILAKSAPNINPLFFEQIKGGDGIMRQFEYTARCEGWSSAGAPDNCKFVASILLCNC